MADLSICGLAMLSVLVSSDELVLDIDQLLERVPYLEPSLGIADVVAWFDQLQLLLDWGLVVREAAPHDFIYKPTAQAVAIVYGHVILPKGAA